MAGAQGTRAARSIHETMVSLTELMLVEGRKSKDEGLFDAFVWNPLAPDHLANPFGEHELDFAAG